MTRKWKWALAIGLPLLLLVGAAWYLVATPAGAGLLAAQAAAAFPRFLPGELRFGEITGSLVGGLSVRQVTVTLPQVRTTIQVNDLELAPDLLATLQRGIALRNLVCSLVRIVGPARADWLEFLPDLPPWGCLAGPAPRFRIDRAAITRVEWIPYASGPVSLSIDGLELGPVGSASPTAMASGTVPGQPLTFALDATFRQVPFLKAAFAGTLDLRGMTARGVASASLLGQPLCSEVAVEAKKQAVVWHGFLQPTELDLAVFNRWLVSLWQQEYPVGFEGRISIGGSWIWDHRLGFLGNLRGELRGWRAVALGLFFPLLEVNSRWTFFDGRLRVEDVGSRLLSAPANLSGEVDLAWDTRQDWQLDLSVPLADLGQLQANLPWTVRYSLGPDQYGGIASLVVGLDGKSGFLRARLEGNQVQIRHPDGESVVSGVLGWRWRWPSPPALDGQFSWTCATGVPRGLVRLRDAGGQPIPLGPSPFTGQGEVRGRTLHDLELRGNFAAGGEAFSLRGVWNGKHWASLHLATATPVELFPMEEGDPALLWNRPVIGDDVIPGDLFSGQSE